jgi:hypothetical protein
MEDTNSTLHPNTPEEQLINLIAEIIIDSVFRKMETPKCCDAHLPAQGRCEQV